MFYLKIALLILGTGYLGMVLITALVLSSHQSRQEDALAKQLLDHADL